MRSHANRWLRILDQRAGGSVTALAVAGNTVYAGGQFMFVDPVDRSHLAAIDANGTLLPWNPGASGGINAIVVSGSTVYIGGVFTTVGNSAHPFLVAVGTNGAVIESFNPQAGSTLNLAVKALVASGNMLYEGITLRLLSRSRAWTRDSLRVRARSKSCRARAARSPL